MCPDIGILADQPRIFLSGVDEPWGALSGLAVSLHNPNVLYSVPDNALPSSIFSIHVGDSFARIRERTSVTKDGVQALYDLEGIAIDTSIVRPKHDAGLLAGIRG